MIQDKVMHIFTEYKTIFLTIDNLKLLQQSPHPAEWILEKDLHVYWFIL